MRLCVNSDVSGLFTLNCGGVPPVLLPRNDHFEKFGEDMATHSMSYSDRMLLSWAWVSIWNTIDFHVAS
jgi:hypothetical protein